MVAAQARPSCGNRPHSDSLLGWLRWHHILGLTFGALALTWTFSGLLSMNPGNWSPSTDATPEQRRHFMGGDWNTRATHNRTRTCFDAQRERSRR
ncbi:MAG: hypothetical protein E2P02_30130 [Acidobacteria bacterium]|nr:MAG: hypothetical protein E2P02_30130 [Acidobacteriota bacterium]